MNEKRPLKETSTDDLLREAAARQDLPDAVSRLGAEPAESGGPSRWDRRRASQQLPLRCWHHRA